MINIKKLTFYRTGEVIRDLGLIYFYRTLTKMKKNNYSEVDANLKANCIEVTNFNENEFCDYIIKCKIFGIFLNGIRTNLKKKIDINFLNEVTQDDFLKLIESNKEIDDKTRNVVNKKFKTKYFPYMRNSPKYGANSQDEENFHNNFKRLVSIVSELGYKEVEAAKEDIILKEYEPTQRKCIVCHTYPAVKYDITHKNEKKERRNSKYNYLFMGSEENTFNNYSEGNSTVCFVCEFFNLMYLLYLALEKPNKLAYTEDLKFMEFLNYKLMLSSSQFTDKELYAKLERLGNTKVRIYDISTDPNKGVLMNFNSVVEIRKLVRDIKLIDLIDRFIFSREGAAKRKTAKTLVRNSNINTVKKFLSSELFVVEDNEGKRSLNSTKTIDNIGAYLEIILLTKKGRIRVEGNCFEKLGKDLCEKFAQSDRKELKRTVAFKINQMLKADNRRGLFDILVHLIITNQLAVPDGFSEIIIGAMDGKENSNQKQDELRYNIGKFLEKFLVEKKGSK